MIDREHELPVVRQCEVLALSRSSVYYLPAPVPSEGLALMRRIDELHLNFPFAGARMLRDLLRLEGFGVGRDRIARLDAPDRRGGALPQAQYQQTPSGLEISIKLPAATRPSCAAGL